jgi:hypothetical protein
MSVTRILVALAIVFFIFAVASGMCFIPGTDIALYLIFGWVPYLLRVVPRLTVRWDMIASTAVYLVLLAAGTHFFLRWLYREVKRAAAPAEPPPPWKWRRTLGGLVVVLLMFAAGTAAVGITHQTAWLVRSPESLYRRGGYARDRVRCASNLRQIGQGIQMYANDNGGRYPDDLRLLRSTGIDIDVTALACPALPDETWTATTGAVANDAPISSYIYFGKGLTTPVDPLRVVAVEPLENHDGAGVNALFGDGTVKWHDRADAERLLLELGFQRVQREK